MWPVKKYLKKRTYMNVNEKNKILNIYIKKKRKKSSKKSIDIIKITARISKRLHLYAF